MNRILSLLQSFKNEQKKAFALLIDPDNVDELQCIELIHLAETAQVDFLFVGGSLITGNNLSRVVEIAKSISTIPVVLFPGSSLHIDTEADAILFLSLISGRNPDFLIGQHILAAPILKRSRLEVLPTGYMLVDTGKQTTASFMSGTTPIPYDKPAVAACIAMAGEMLGLQLIYLDGGSGAEKPISPQMIQAVRKSVDTPILVGGGINTAEKALQAIRAGADVIVVGNAIEKDPTLVLEIAQSVKSFLPSLS
ncbi:geranylgeranylglyceryl/heptaprenylglyceryl phosphate synthase [Raineya sp.]|jgi:putative glycerol-1-phosphate prenyltransferase